MTLLKLVKHINDIAETIGNTKFATDYKMVDASFDHAFGTHHCEEAEVTEYYKDGQQDKKQFLALWEKIKKDVTKAFKDELADSLDKYFVEIDQFLLDLSDKYDRLKVDGDIDWSDDDLPPDLEESSIIDYVLPELFHEI